MGKVLIDPPSIENAPLPSGANPTTEIRAMQGLALKPDSRAPRAPFVPAFNGDKIPESIKANNRWAPWKAEWDEKRQKFDKIPGDLEGHGLSTAKPERWYSYEVAHKAYTNDPQMFAGMGYVMTSPHGVVGIDLDNCVRDNTIDDWALDVINELGSYTELSPSGKGLRILAAGSIPRDWTNHEVGIEVYGGHKARFLTVTGQRLKISIATSGVPQYCYEA